jgi:hypothetical protein
MRITRDTGAPIINILEVGDLVITNQAPPAAYLAVSDNKGENMGLMDMDDHSCNFEFNHPTHVVNWLNKHHGGFIIIKQNRLELTYV